MATNSDTLPEADFDLDGWIDGTQGITGTARIYQRGDLLAELDNLERRIEIAKGVSVQDRGADDDTPETLRAQWDELAQQIVNSSITVHIQDRTIGRRQQIVERLKREDKVTDTATINLYLLADAIIKVETADGRTKTFADGFPPEKLRQIRDRCGDNVLTAAWATYERVISKEPDVSGPTSRRYSSSRGGLM